MKSSVERTGRIAPLLVIVSLAAAALVASNADPAPAEATAQRCAQYAQREVQQYQLYKSHPQCQANTTSMAWSGNYEDAYNGCLKVPAAMAKFVEGRRESHLQSCGALGGASGGAAPANGGHAGNYLGTGGSGPSGGAGNNSGSGNSGSSGSRPANSGSGHSSSGASGPGAPAGTAANGSSQSSGAPPQGLPPRMHFCGISHCGTLTWNSGHYDAIFDDTQAMGVTAKFTIVQFDSSGGVVNRVDTGGQTFTLTGKLSPQGNSVIDGKQTRIVPGGNAASPNPYMLTW